MSDEDTLQSRLENARRGELSSGALFPLMRELFLANREEDGNEVLKILQKERDEVAKERDEVAKERDGLAKEKYENAPAVASSIENIYQGGRTLPPLKLNSNVAPSIKGHYLKGMEPQKAIYKKEASTSAEIWKQLDQVVIPIRTKVEGNDDQDPVRIFSEFKPNLYPLNYENEIKIQTYVERLVMDAIACMGCTNKLQTNLEISFYGVTPDIIVVFHRRKIIFVIEVKSPSVEVRSRKRQAKPRKNKAKPGDDDGGSDVFEGQWVAGQIWLYLMAMKQSGVERPLGAICTFNKIRLVSLKPMDHHRFEEALGMLKETVATPWKPEQQPTKDEQQHSPDPERKRASEKSLRFDKKQPATSFEPDAKDGVKIFKAFLYGSVTAEEGNVFRMLLLGLMTAKIEAGIGATANTVTEGKENEDLSCRLFAYATEQGLRFAMTDDKLKVKNEFPHPNTKNFFLLDTIGSGGTGDVSLAVSLNGARAAVKFYRFKPSRAATPDERAKDDEKLIAKCKENRNEELSRWKNLYGKGCKDSIGRAMQTGRAIMLRGLPSLLVPYGTRIPMNKRAACLGAIEEQLKRFLKAGYVYKESDLRWRHILFLGDGNDEKVFLADLGSLQTVPPSDRSDNSKVEEQMNYLKTHMVMEVDGGEDDGGDAKTESGKKRPQQPTGGSPASKKAKV